MSFEDKLSYEYSVNFDSEIQFAFRIGLLWNDLPEWIKDGLEKVYSWGNCQMKIDIIAETKDSWHEGYRELRKYNWKRISADRSGGLITYLLQFDVPESMKETLPKDYHSTIIRYRVTLPTCRQVKTGTKEVDVFETVCDDIVEPEEESDTHTTSSVIEPSSLIGGA